MAHGHLRTAKRTCRGSHHRLAITQHARNIMILNNKYPSAATDRLTLRQTDDQTGDVGKAGQATLSPRPQTSPRLRAVLPRQPSASKLATSTWGS